MNLEFNVVFLFQSFLVLKLCLARYLCCETCIASSLFDNCPLSLSQTFMFKPSNVQEVVEKERDNYLDKLDEPEKSQVKWEHVGSTSIKVLMSNGSMSDLLLYMKEK